jgi:TPP-dependent 2-oxoacid decarboxylase
MNVTTYLLSRLAELGVRHIFGVPGDYNMPMLDVVEQHHDIAWIGTANELNAAYAADGYARVRGAGALITTYGVGELSAINAIAGAYAESVPVVHIVGGPNTATQEAGAPVHHTFADGDFQRFSRMAAEVTAAQTQLSFTNAAHEIDRVLHAALYFRKPVHIVVPKDVATATIEHPRKKLAATMDTNVNVANLAAFTKRARSMLTNARRVSVLVGHLVDRFDARAQIEHLLGTPKVRVAILSTAKGVVDEGDPHFLGLYAGALSDEYTRATVEESDVIVTAGVLLADSTTGGFTHQLPLARRIDAGAHDANIAGIAYQGVPLTESLTAVTQILWKDAA